MWEITVVIDGCENSSGISLNGYNGKKGGFERADLYRPYK